MAAPANRPPPATHHALPMPFSSSSSSTTTTANNNNSLHLLTQGAEALLYKTTFLHPSTPCALKHRPPKPWRHPTLDARLTRARILSEARVLVRCRRLGVRVPAVLGLDWENGWLAMEWIQGATVRAVLEWSKRRRGGENNEEVERLMERIGITLAGLHDAGVVHGDLTTSNIMLRPFSSTTQAHTRLEGEVTEVEEAEETEEEEIQSLDGEIVLIDFGLATQSVQEEDKAVDLYVLERAFGSTHPEVEDRFKDVLKAYGEAGGKTAKVVLKRLEDVRMRGRKKSMIG